MAKISSSLRKVLAKGNSRQNSLAIANPMAQRRRDDNKNKISAFEGGGLGGREENRPKTLFFIGNATTI